MSDTSAARLRNEFRAEVLRGLRTPEKHLPCKYFYDAIGSALFERICALEEYYLTRTEWAVMQCHAAEMAARLGPRCLVIEYGIGAGIKTHLLLDHLTEPRAYVPVDLACDALKTAAQALTARYPALEVKPVCADFTGDWTLPSVGLTAQRRVIYFPGSTVGNLTEDETVVLLRRAAHLCGPGGGFLLGADLKKDPAVLHAAYNDRDGVTADFNLNLLARINRELDGTFDLNGFWHHAFYTPRAGRIEMHLVSRRSQHVRVAGEGFFFAEGESILTEYSKKYSLEDIRRLTEAGGWRIEQAWSDEQQFFGVFALTLGRA